MKRILIAMAAALVVLRAAAASGGGDCRSIEYAELKDMSTESLRATYCRYGRLAETYIEAYKTFLNIFIHQGGITTSDLSELRFSYQECFDIKTKIRTALSARSLPAEPNCDLKNNQ